MRRRSVRVAEGARLESVYTLIAYRGFESLLLHQINTAGVMELVDIRDLKSRGCYGRGGSSPPTGTKTKKTYCKRNI